MFVFFRLGVGRDRCSVLPIVRGYFVFSSKPGSTGTFYFQVALKGCFPFKKKYEGTREGQIGSSCVSLCNENLPSNFTKVLWLNLPHRAVLPPGLEDLAFRVQTQYIIQISLQIWQFAMVQRLLSTHYCLGIICLFIAHHLHFLEYLAWLL